MSEQHSVVLIIAPVNLSEMRLEVCHYSIVLVRTIAIRSDAVERLNPRSVRVEYRTTHYLLTLTPAAIFAFNISVLSVHSDQCVVHERLARHLLRKSTKAQRFSRAFEQICLNN